MLLIAFAHLKRTIVVDAGFRKEWANAFKAGEVSCEKLGAVHLLSHRIWAFKAHASGGYTDLVLGKPIKQLDQTELSASRGLVLTEWKVATRKDLYKKLGQADRQLDYYSKETLSATELERVQYAVIVSEKELAMPVNKIFGRVTRRYINVPVKPAVASKQRSRAAK